MKKEGFENLNVWQRSRELVNQVYLMTKDSKFYKDRILMDQIRKSAISVLSNISEGYERGSNSDFIRFLYIPKASCGELRAQLFITKDQGYINEKEFEQTIDTSRRVSGMLGNLISYLKKHKGKFKVSVDDDN
ncbi:MAG: four helix bundle protein [candidate division Zixibacteria bacterium]|nr:four helix bundle protein [candidate division Zixibacteria bacterium]